MAIDAAAAGVTVTLAVAVTATVPFTVALTVFVSALVELSVPVTWPFAPVAPAGCESALFAPVDPSVTVAPLTGFPNSSFTVTVIVAAFAPEDAAIVPGAAATSERAALGAPAVPVAVKVIGLPFTPGAVAVSVFWPAAVPSVQVPTVAMPPASVVWLAPVMLPFPAVTAKVTATPGTGLPLASFTITEGAICTAVPAVTVWLLPAFTAIWVAAPAIRVTCPEVTTASCGAVKLSVRGPATPVMVRFVNAARPPASVAIGFTPDRAGPPVAMVAVTGVPLWLTGLPA